MNTLARLCQVEDILLNVDVQNKQQLFEHVAQHLYKRHGISQEAVAKHFNEREKLGSTGLGQGVAIPHARLVEVGQPMVTFVRTVRPILFDAPDGKPVGDFFLLLVPEHANQAHLQLLADAASLLCERSFRDALRAGVAPQDIRRLLLDWSQS